MLRISSTERHIQTIEVEMFRRRAARHFDLFELSSRKNYRTEADRFKFFCEVVSECMDEIEQSFVREEIAKRQFQTRPALFQRVRNFYRGMKESFQRCLHEVALWLFGEG